MASMTAKVLLSACVFVAAGVLIFRCSAPPKDRKQAGCTNADARGDFGYQFQGWVQSDPRGPFLLFAETGRWTADGAGNYNGSSTFSYGGKFFTHTFTGTYQINPDCSGSAIVPKDSLGSTNLKFYWVIVEPGEEILLVSMAGVSAVNGRAERLSR